MEESSDPCNDLQAPDDGDLVVLSDADEDLQTSESLKEIDLAEKSKESPKSMSDVDEAIEDFVLADSEEGNAGTPVPNEESDSLKVPNEHLDNDVVIVMEDLKANSDDECFIVDDDSDEIIIKDDDGPESKTCKQLNGGESNTGSQSNKTDGTQLALNKTSTHSSEPTPDLETKTVTLPESSPTVMPASSSENIEMPTLARSDISEPNVSVSLTLPSADEKGLDVIDLKDSQNKAATGSSIATIKSENVGCENEVMSSAQEVLEELLDKLVISKESISSSDLPSSSGNTTHSESEKIDSNGSEQPSETPAGTDEIKEPKKRKMSEEKSDQILKKIKDKLADDIEITVLDSEVASCVEEKVSSIVSPQHFGMIKTKTKFLDTIAKDLCFQAVTELFKKEIADEEAVVFDLERRLLSLDESLTMFKLEAGKLLSVQQDTFKKNNHDPLVHTRTVGVNVKIVRDCDLIKPPLLPPTIRVPPAILQSQKVSTPMPTLGPSARALFQLSQKPSVVQTVPVPRLLVRNAVPSPRFRATVPNVTMAGNALAPGLSLAKAATSASGGSIIDLTDDETTSKGTPGAANQPKVLVPIRSFIQMLPNGQKIRQAILPSQRFGGKNVLGTCFVANNNTVRGPVLPPPSQMPTTYFVQLPSNSAASALKSLVPASAPPRAPATAPSTPSKGPPSTAAPPLMLIPQTLMSHPAPFPPLGPPVVPFSKMPPKPSLKGSRAPNGIILSWNISAQSPKNLTISKYQLFAYQEGPGPITSALWKKVGDVHSLPLPMACTLTQFTPGYRYYFAVRAVDSGGIQGPYSDPVSIMYTQEK